MARRISEAIQRKWLGWDAFPPNWVFIMKRVESFRCTRIVKRSAWNRPDKGWMKINWTANVEKTDCGFIIRNSRGHFYLAGVYSLQPSIEWTDLMNQMVQDCVNWCERKCIYQVVLETDLRRKWERGTTMGSVKLKVEYCSKEVNCMAKCILRGCSGQNVVFRRLEGLLGAVLFMFSSGRDCPTLVLSQGMIMYNVIILAMLMMAGCLVSWCWSGMCVRSGVSFGLFREESFEVKDECFVWDPRGLLL